jgi:hypothetical protein
MFLHFEASFPPPPRKFYFPWNVGLPFWRTLVERDTVLCVFIYHCTFGHFATDSTLIDVIVCDFQRRNIRPLILFGAVGQKYVFCSTLKLQDNLEELHKLTSTCRPPVSQSRFRQYWPIVTVWTKTKDTQSELHPRSMSQFSAFVLPSPPPNWDFQSVFSGHKDNLHYVFLIEPGGVEIYLTCPDRPWGPPGLLYNGYWLFSGDKAAEAWR